MRYTSFHLLVIAKTLFFTVIVAFHLPRQQTKRVYPSNSSCTSNLIVVRGSTFESISKHLNHDNDEDTRRKFIYSTMCDGTQWRRKHSHTRFMSGSNEETPSVGDLERNDEGPSKDDMEKGIIPPKEFIQTLHELSINQLLILLEKYNITIPPGATKDQLVDILIRSQLKNVNQNRRVKDEEQIPLWEQRRRQRLEQSVYTNTSATTNTNQPRRRSKSSSHSSSLPKMKQRPQRRERNYDSFKWDDVDLESTSRIAKRLGSTAANAAKYATNDFSNRMKHIVKTIYDPKDVVDENGIRDARWKYVYKNVEMTKDDMRQKQRQRNTAFKTNRRTMKRSLDKNGKNEYPGVKTTRTTTDARKNNDSVSSSVVNALPPILNDTEYFPDISNKFSKHGKNPTITNVTQNATDPVTNQRDTRRKDRQSYDAKKKVYSVYPIKEGDQEQKELEDLYGEAIVSAIDTVGEFVADVTEGRYWGNTTGIGSSVSSNRTTSKTMKESSSTSKPHKKRYWRDRLTERVDYALGVHEDGKYYRSWQDQLEREKSQERGNDAVSIFYGRQKKDRGPKRPVAFWEEDGSLMSLFFGRTPDGKTLSLSKLFERENSVNICTTIFKSSFKTFLAIFSYLCRWASCRGALPQPIVVFLLAASALSAPKRRRLMTMGITLIALRTLAEIIHGYIYGNEDWEDEEVYFDDERGGKEGAEEWEGDGL